MTRRLTNFENKTIANSNKSDKEVRDYWSECGQIFFHYGKGYGVTTTLHNIYLGSEESIMKYLNNGKAQDNFNPKQLEVLNQIKIFRLEEGIGESNPRTTNMERAGDNGAFRHKPKATRLLTPRKRLSLRSSRTKGKSLSRR